MYTYYDTILSSSGLILKSEKMSTSQRPECTSIRVGNRRLDLQLNFLQRQFNSQHFSGEISKDYVKFTFLCANMLKHYCNCWANLCVFYPLKLETVMTSMSEVCVGG